MDQIMQSSANDDALASIRREHADIKEIVKAVEPDDFRADCVTWGIMLRNAWAEAMRA